MVPGFQSETTNSRQSNLLGCRYQCCGLCRRRLFLFGQPRHEDVDAIEILLSCRDQLRPIGVLRSEGNAQKKVHGYADPGVGPFRDACAARTSVRSA